ncbi:hypothetical protein Drorol1_Dr00016631 [Drosera rotundifolia]
MRIRRRLGLNEGGGEQIGEEESSHPSSASPPKLCDFSFSSPSSTTAPHRLHLDSLSQTPSIPAPCSPHLRFFLLARLLHCGRLPSPPSPAASRRNKGGGDDAARCDGAQRLWFDAAAGSQGDAALGFLLLVATDLHNEGGGTWGWNKVEARLNSLLALGAASDGWRDLVSVVVMNPMMVKWCLGRWCRLGG